MKTMIGAMNEDENRRPTAHKTNQVCDEQERRRILGRVYAFLLGLADQASAEAGNGNCPENSTEREAMTPASEAGEGWSSDN